MLGYVSTRIEFKLQGKDILFQVSVPKPPDWKVDIMGKPFGPR